MAGNDLNLLLGIVCHELILIEVVMAPPEDSCLRNKSDGWTGPHPLQYRYVSSCNHQEEDILGENKFAKVKPLTIRCGSSTTGIRSSIRALDKAVVNRKKAITSDFMFGGDRAYAIS
jgi:hypothetical protein